MSRFHRFHRFHKVHKVDRFHRMQMGTMNKGTRMADTMTSRARRWAIRASRVSRASQ